jgi:pyruvate,orthophosphate dikinase
MYLLNEIPDKLMTKEHLGGKGYGLAVMSQDLKLPVPEAIIIPTQCCVDYLKLDSTNRAHYCQALAQEALDKSDGVLFTQSNPCVSVRSGARVSMPGMMDTILNVGITEQTIGHLANAIGKEAAYDSWGRLIEMFGVTVRGHAKEDYHCEDLDAMGRYEHHRDLFEQLAGPFPNSILAQVSQAIRAVFDSWNSERARVYRAKHNIPDNWGTAVVIQKMVFGNRDEKSASGVMFTRDPATGENKMVGEYVVCGQGEDVVSGAVTPKNLETLDTALYEQVLDLAVALEEHFNDAQDVEFTIESGKLYVLQTRTAKRTATAHVVIAQDLWKAGRLSLQAALKRIPLSIVPSLSVSTVAGSAKADFTGLAAGGGAVHGIACFNMQQLEAAQGQGILIADETSPDDFPMMVKSVAILTSTGGITCHAAVVARGMDKTCVVGCAGVTGIPAGQKITVDGLTGAVYMGHPELETAAGLDVLMGMLKAAKGDGIGHPGCVIAKGTPFEDVFQSVTSCWDDPDSGHGLMPEAHGLTKEGEFLIGMFNQYAGGAQAVITPTNLGELLQLSASVEGVIAQSYVYNALGGPHVLAQLQKAGLVSKSIALPAIHLDEALEGLLG